MRYYTHKYTKLRRSEVDEVLHSQIYQVETVAVGDVLHSHKYTKLRRSEVDELLHSQIYQVERVSSG